MEATERSIPLRITNIYGNQWSWSIDTLNSVSDSLYSCIGSLEIPQYGSRSGYGQGQKPEDAIRDAMLNSLALFQLDVQERPDQSPKQRQVLTEKSSPTTYAEKAAELKNVYDIKTRLEFVTFTQVWNKNITSFEMIDENAMNQLHEYVDKNPEEFESFIKRA